VITQTIYSENLVPELWRVPRVRHAEERLDSVGRGRQVRNRRVHRRGGAVDPRTTDRQSFVHVFSARGRAHGQPGETSGSATVRNQQVQSHFGPEPKDLRRYLNFNQTTVKQQN